MEGISRAARERVVRRRDFPDACIFRERQCHQRSLVLLLAIRCVPALPRDVGDGDIGRQKAYPDLLGRESATFVEAGQESLVVLTNLNQLLTPPRVMEPMIAA